MRINKDKIGSIVEGHFCFDCLKYVDPAEPSPGNPTKTDFCVRCEHRKAGLNSRALVGNWLILGPTKLTMPEYTKEQIDEARERVRGIREIAMVGGKPTHDEKLILALDSALSTAEQELAFFKKRERDICKAVGGVSDGGHYRADVIEHLQIVYKKAQERDALKARCAELEARLQGAPQVYADIMAERKRQDEKWGVQRHHPTEWLSILGEEFGEVCKAVCEAHFSGYESTGKWDQYRVELIHTAAVAVSMIECHDAIVGKKEG